MYFVRGRVKLTIALGKGKKLHDKRDAIREREDKLAMAKALKQERSSRDD
jgi:SsrA-binding protein